MQPHYQHFIFSIFSILDAVHDHDSSTNNLLSYTYSNRYSLSLLQNMAMEEITFQFEKNERSHVKYLCTHLFMNSNFIEFHINAIYNKKNCLMNVWIKWNEEMNFFCIRMNITFPFNWMLPHKFFIVMLKNDQRNTSKSLKVWIAIHLLTKR